jgi:multidrug efflux pump subunit AcrB
MEKTVRWSLKNRSVVFLATVILIASGVYATTRLNQELLPDIEFPIITVSTPVPGAGPDVVDEQVTQPIEGAVDDVEGIESIQSASSGGFSVLVIEFALDTDTKEAEAELGSALDGVALPQQAEEPEVRSQSASEFPIMSVSLSAGDGELAELTDYARDEAVPLIEDVEGVARADLVGGAEREIEVELDAEKLRAYDLSADAVVGAISGAASVNTPVGDVEIDGLSTPVRTTSGLAGPAALGLRSARPKRCREELRRAFLRLGLLRASPPGVGLRSRSCSGK